MTRRERFWFGLAIAILYLATIAGFISVQNTTDDLHAEIRRSIKVDRDQQKLLCEHARENYDAIIVIAGAIGEPIELPIVAPEVLAATNARLVERRDEILKAVGKRPEC